MGQFIELRSNIVELDFTRDQEMEGVSILDFFGARDRADWGFFDPIDRDAQVTCESEEDGTEFTLNARELLLA